MSIGESWAGRVFGTHTGNMFLRFSKLENPLVGTLHFNDSHYGIAVYNINANFFDGKLEISGTSITSKENVEFGDLIASATLNSKGELEGDWSTDNGAAGTFLLFPHGRSRDSVEAEQKPNQLYTARHQLGAIEIDRQQIVSIAENVQKEFPVGRVVVTVVCGTEEARFLPEFRDAKFHNQKASIVRIFVQEPERGGANRTVSIEFGPQVNLIMTQSSDEAWALGKLETLKRELSQNERSYTTNFKRLGFGVNQMLLIWAVVYIPSLPGLTERIVFMASVVLIVFAVNWLHGRYLPFAAIYLTERPAGLVETLGPSVLSWLIAVASGVAATVLSLYLQQWLPLISNLQSVP